MVYRKLGKTGISVSEVGLGCEHLEGKALPLVESVIHTALDAGVNVMDIFMAEPDVRSNIGLALGSRRKDAVLQGHIGAAWIDGQYKRTRDPDICKAAFEDFMARLRTDYVDVGMIHFVDTEEDFDAVFGGPVARYAEELKRSGVIRAIGMSSHSPVIAERAVKTGLVDVLMFSLNPAFDILPGETDLDGMFKPDVYKDSALAGIDPSRASLYQTCEAMGTGITVMKGYASASLLSAEKSPFGVALTTNQCIHYALTRPAVASILVGCTSPEQVLAAVAYEDADEAARDYSVVLSRTPQFSMRGKCMYCNHCLPCPSQIDIAAVNKYLDLAEAAGGATPTLKEHYAALRSHASDCTACGSCEPNCPFDVSVIERMERAAALFGN